MPNPLTLPGPVATEILNYYHDSQKLKKVKPMFIDLEQLIMTANVRPSQLLHIKKQLDQIRHAIG